MDDAALIAGALAGSTRDFETLVERHQRVVYALALRRLQDADAADDVVQATFVQAWRHLRRFRGEASFRTWIMRIALNECRAQRRSRHAAAVRLDDVPESALPVAPAPADHGWRAHLAQLVERLPPRQRAVLRLRVWSDLPFRDIADRERITENAAKVNYHHAVARVRRWLGEETG